MLVEQLSQTSFDYCYKTFCLSVSLGVCPTNLHMLHPKLYTKSFNFSSKFPAAVTSDYIRQPKSRKYMVIEGIGYFLRGLTPKWNKFNPLTKSIYHDKAVSVAFGTYG